MKNPCVRRLLQECRELSEEASRDLACEPLEDDLFEWHFALRGPNDTEFEARFLLGALSGVCGAFLWRFQGPPSRAWLTPRGVCCVSCRVASTTAASLCRQNTRSSRRRSAS
jgi:ubiquitin-conjugating enzyme E2 J1